MDENHQDKTESKQTATANKLSPPPLSTKDHRGADRPQNNRQGAFIKRLGVFGYDKETKEYTSDGQLAKITKEHQPGKTLWDWLQLVGILLIPLVIFLATMRFNQQQADLAQQQDKADQQSALDQQRQATLVTYLDNMNNLLLNRGLLNSKPNDEVRVIALTETLSAMRQLDGKRNSSLVRFLRDAHLSGEDINTMARYNIVNFLDADLSGGIDFSGADFAGADFSGANLLGADFSGSGLFVADFSGAYLSRANFSDAYLSRADLSRADLSSVDLNRADLSSASHLTQQQLDQVYSCQAATLPQGLTCHHNQSIP